MSSEHARDTVDHDVPLQGPAKRNRIDLGLALLSCAAKPGVRYSHEEIAAWAGCTDSLIIATEQRAMRKLRNRLLFLKDPVLRELVDSVVSKKG